MENVEPARQMSRNLSPSLNTNEVAERSQTMAKRDGNSGKRGRGRPRGSGKSKKRKRVNVQFLKREHSGKVTEPYKILDRL